jgi:hypothetical protein
MKTFSKKLLKHLIIVAITFFSLVNKFYTCLIILSVLAYNYFYSNRACSLNNYCYLDLDLIFLYAVSALTVFIVNYFYGIYVFTKSGFRKYFKYFWIIHVWLTVIYLLFYSSYLNSLLEITNWILFYYFTVFLTIFFTFFSQFFLQKETIKPRRNNQIDYSKM